MPNRKKTWRYQKEKNFSQEPLILKDRNYSLAEFCDTNEKATSFITRASLSNEPKIKLNIAGARIEITERLLSKYPNTLLGTESKRLPFYDKYKN